MRDLVVGDNDWYNVTPSVRRAIEGFALILRDHEARLMNGGDSTTATARSPSEEFGSSTLEVAQLKDRIARLEEELAVAKRRVAEVTDVAVRAASDAKTAVVEVNAVRPDVDRLATGLSSLHTAVGAHLKDIRGELANGVGQLQPGNAHLRVRSTRGRAGGRVARRTVTSRGGCETSRATWRDSSTRTAEPASPVASPSWRTTTRRWSAGRGGWSAWWRT